jgi:hypothetical protein
VIRVGDTYRAWFAFVASKVGKAGLTVTVDVVDESGNVSAGHSASAGAVDGMYYYDFTVDAAGVWTYVGKTTDATVDAQHVFGAVIVEAALTAARAANLDNLDAAISDVPTASQIAQAVWDVLTSALTTAGSVGAYLLSKLGILTSGTTPTVRSPVASSLAVETFSGDDYYDADGRALVWSSLDCADLTDPSDATISLVISEAASDGSDLTFTPTVTDTDEVTLELSSDDTSTIAASAHDYYIVATRASGHEETLVYASWTSRAR